MVVRANTKSRESSQSPQHAEQRCGQHRTRCGQFLDIAGFMLVNLVSDPQIGYEADHARHLKAADQQIQGFTILINIRTIRHDGPLKGGMRSRTIYRTLPPRNSRLGGMWGRRESYRWRHGGYTTIKKK
jgi:hypothetical protein